MKHAILALALFAAPAASQTSQVGGDGVMSLNEAQTRWAFYSKAAP